jgi:hypothetical protein
MKKDFFDILSKAILETQVDGKNILYFSGKFAGYECNVRKTKNLEELKIAIDSILKELSVGKVESIEKRSNNIMIKIRSRFNGKNHFMLGFVTGIVSKALDYNFYRFAGKQIRCNSRGKFCLFEIKSI